MDDDDLPAGETMDLPDNDSDVTDTPDGGAIIRVDTAPKPGDSEFYSNLAESGANVDLQKLSIQILDLVEEDQKSREKRDKQYEEGLRRTGLGNDAPGGAQFEGASRVVHPMLVEGSVDFASRAIKELFPADGPTKSKIIGQVTQDRAAKAARKSDFMNWQLTTQCRGFRPDFEQLLTQLPLGGAQYMKLSWDERRNRPDFLTIYIDDMLLPFAASSFYTAERKTHVQYLTQQGYLQSVKEGLYIDVDLQPTVQAPDQTAAQKANDKIEGREDNAYNKDGLRRIYEVYLTVNVGWDDETEGPAPYIVTIDKQTREVLSVYRNWDADDDTQEELQWIVEFPFVPWRGAYPIGLTHMIGGLSGAATGALRALLDSAHISNSQTMLKLKGGGRGGQSIEMDPGTINEIEGGINVDDIRKLAMPLPYNQPSATLYQLLGFLVDAGKSVVRTTIENAPDSNPNVPVGTTLANIEQGMVVFNAIHARLHDAMANVLRILHRLNGLYLDDKASQGETGDLLASRSDFQGPMDVAPVSDPNIFSEAQRFAQVQAVASRAQLQPQLYDLRAVEERILTTLKIPDPLGLLQAKSTPQRDNAVSENVKASLGRPVVAFPDEDHIAHLSTHMAFLMAPQLGSSPLIAPAFAPAILQHMKEHVVLWYAAETFDIVKQAARDTVDEDFEQMMAEAKTPDDKKALDRAIAAASQQAVVESQTTFGKSMPVAIQQAHALIQQFAPPPPADPAAAAAMADVQMRGQLGQQKNQNDAAKIAQQGQAEQGDQQNEQQKLQFMLVEQDREDQRTEAELKTRMELNSADNATDIELADMHATAKPHAPTTDNPNP